jgi:hypothetical protein
VGFEIIHVGAVAVHVFTNRVPGAMHKESAIPVPVNDLTRRVVNLLAV